MGGSLCVGSWCCVAQIFDFILIYLFKLSNKGMFTPVVKTMVIVFKENVKILASTPNVMVTIKNDVASDMALNDNTLLTKEVN